MRRWYLQYLNKYSNQIQSKDIEFQAFDERGKPVYPRYFCFTEIKFVTDFQNTWSQPELHRSVLPNELLLELDEPSITRNLTVAKLVCRILSREGIPYWLFYSGGKGFHVSTFLELSTPPKELNEKMEKGGFDWYGFRNYLAWRVIGDVRRCFKVDRLKLVQRRTLIRACGSLHHAGGFYKVYLGAEDVLPSTASDFEKYQIKDPVVANEFYPEELVEWGADEWMPYIENYLKYLAKKKPKKPMVKGAKKPMLCLDYFLSNPLPDGRERAVILLANRLKYSYAEDALLKRLYEWNNNHQGGHLPRSLINSKVKYAYHYKSGLGCNYARSILGDINQLGLCESCKEAGHER